MLIFAPAVLADTLGTAVVSGDIAPTLSLTMTSGTFSFGSMTTGTNVNSTGNPIDAQVVSNTPWTIVVADALTDSKPSGTAGKMAEWDGTSAYVLSGKVLTNPFEMSKDGSTYVALSGTPQTLFSGTSGTFDNYPALRQTIASGDEGLLNSHVYRIVTTFTVSAT